MNYFGFLDQIIHDGIEAAKRDYKNDVLKRDGAVAGFEACRGRSPEQLFELLQKAHDLTMEAYRSEAQDYWKTRCYEAEIEWTCNCVSAMLVSSGGKALTSYQPTVRAMLKVAEVLGVSQPN